MKHYAIALVITVLAATAAFAADDVANSAAFRKARALLAEDNAPAAYALLIRAAVQSGSRRAEYAAIRLYRDMNPEQRELARQIAAQHRDTRIISRRSSSQTLSASDF